jgi:micrococcal nuclease
MALRMTGYPKLKMGRRGGWGATLITVALVVYYLVAPPGKASPAPVPAVTPTPFQTPVLGAADVSPSAVLTVSRVVDGDTIVVGSGKTKETVRLIGVDTPEVVDPRKPVQCFGKEASAETKRLLNGRSVRLEADPTQGDRDKYGRLLRYVYRDDGLFVNRELVANGFAHEYTYDIPYRFRDEFRNAETAARTAGKGLWAPGVCGS